MGFPAAAATEHPSADVPPPQQWAAFDDDRQSWTGTDAEDNYSISADALRVPQAAVPPPLAGGWAAAATAGGEPAAARRPAAQLPLGAPNGNAQVSYEQAPPTSKLVTRMFGQVGEPSSLAYSCILHPARLPV